MTVKVLGIKNIAQVDESKYKLVAYVKSRMLYASPIFDQVLSFRSIESNPGDGNNQNCMYFVLKSQDGNKTSLYIEVCTVYRNIETEEVHVEMKYVHKMGALLEAVFYCLTPVEDCDFYTYNFENDVWDKCKLPDIWNDKFLDFHNHH